MSSTHLSPVSIYVGASFGIKRVENTFSCKQNKQLCMNSWCLSDGFPKFSKESKKRTSDKINNHAPSVDAIVEQLDPLKRRKLNEPDTLSLLQNSKVILQELLEEKQKDSILRGSILEKLEAAIK